jgi:hypothetical protein
VVTEPGELGSVMSSRLDKSWKVLTSYQTTEADRCVDMFCRANGTFGYEEFRRDPEDRGAWTAISYFSDREFASEHDTLRSALTSVLWLGPLLGRCDDPTVSVAR